MELDQGGFLGAAKQGDVPDTARCTVRHGGLRFLLWVSPGGFPGNLRDEVIYFQQGCFYSLVKVGSVRSYSVCVLFKKAKGWAGLR